MTKATLTSVEVRDGLAVLDWDDGRRTTLHSVWLRERCPMPESRDPRTGQRLLDAWSLPLDLRVETARLEAPDVVEVTFSDGHLSRFPVGELQEELDPGPGAADLIPACMVAWNTADPPHSEADFEAVRRDEGALLDMLRALHRYGFVVVRNVGTEMDALGDFAGLIGPLRETNWGRIADVKAIPKAYDLTMTTRALEQHTDNPYREPVPGYVLLHCLVNDVDGGDSTVTDGFHAALTLRERDREGFETLTRVRPHFRYADDTTVLENDGPLIELSPNGQLKQVRLSNRTDSVPAHAPEVLERYYRARRAFTDIVNDPAYKLRFKLGPGDLMVMDNHRLLHGRTGYTAGSGHRHMRQGYMDRDSVASRRKVLERRLGQVGEEMA